MKLIIGLVFQKYYSECNINNIQYCEVRGIIDESVIVLYCKKNKTKMSEAKEFYSMIYVEDFNYNCEHNIYIPC